MLTAFNVSSRNLRALIAVFRAAHGNADFHNWNHAMRSLIPWYSCWFNLWSFDCFVFTRTIHGVYWFLTVAGGSVHIRQEECMAMLLASLTYSIDHPGVNDPILLHSKNDFERFHDTVPALKDHFSSLVKVVRCKIERSVLPSCHMSY